MTKTIIAIHGLQGSGKSTLAQVLLNSISTSEYICIKDSFRNCAQKVWGVISEYPDSFTATLRSQEALFFKELQRSISTLGERFDPEIWSNMYKQKVLDSKSKFIVTDDIRTPMNLSVLSELAKDHRVLLVRLYCDESVRKDRATVWRDITDYTEVQLESGNEDLNTLDAHTVWMGPVSVAACVAQALSSPNVPFGEEHITYTPFRTAK